MPLPISVRTKLSDAGFQANEANLAEHYQCLHAALQRKAVQEYCP